MVVLEMLCSSVSVLRCFYFGWIALTTDVRINQVTYILSSLSHYK